jgi:hypothetical protein
MVVPASTPPSNPPIQPTQPSINFADPNNPAGNPPANPGNVSPEPQLKDVLDIPVIPEGHWANQIDDNLKKSGTLKNLLSEKDPIQALNKVFNMYENVQPLIGQKVPSNGDDKSLLEFRSKNGAPEEYKPVESIKMPDGTEAKINDDVQFFLKECCSERKLTQSDFDAICQKVVQLQSSAPERCKQMLTEDYGEGWAEKINQQAQSTFSLIPESVRNRVNEKGLMNNPEFQLAMASISNLVGESQFTPNIQQVQHTKQTHTGDYDSQINQAQREVTVAYQENNFNPQHPKVVSAQEKVNKLFQQKAAALGNNYQFTQT